MDLLTYWQIRTRLGEPWWDDASYIAYQSDPSVFFEDLDPNDGRSLEEILSALVKEREERRKDAVYLERKARLEDQMPF